MRNQVRNYVALTVAAFMFAIALSAPANASSLREATTPSNAEVTGSLPGQVLWTDYWIHRQTFCFGTDDCVILNLGDTILHLVNPNGGANDNLVGNQSQTVCAMIYVFDADQEMGECCGCPLSSAQLATFSVEHNLTSDWALSGGTDDGAHDNGAIAVVAAAPNAPECSTESGACNGGCDPTNLPGYTVTTQNNLLGSRTLSKRRQKLSIGGLAEIELNDDGGGDPTNLTYLQNQCGALIGNGTEGGICTCPTE